VCHKNQHEISINSDFRQWLGDSDNVESLKKIKGIKDKTANYFKILVGIQTNAIDRHLLSFLSQAGIGVSNYEEASDVINAAADILGVPRAHFDHSIWHYQAGKSTKSCKS
jgi:thermostable 8-oxoguanine DNA glycosylase